MRFVWIALLVVVAAGGALRFNAAANPTEYQSKDERSYALLAKDIVLKHKYGVRGMKDPVHWVPGAPVLFATAYYFDREPPRSEERPDVPAAYPWQAGVGTLLILATFAFGLVLAGRVAGLIAAAAVAFYPPLIAASADLLSEPLGALLATVALTVTVLAIRDPGRYRWKAVLAGLLFAATVLTRADLALLPLVAAAAMGGAAWMAQRGRTRATGEPEEVSGEASAEASGEGRRRRGRIPVGPRAAGVAMAPFLVALFLGVLPWTIYASNEAGTFVPLSNGGGSNLFIGTYLPGEGKLFGTKKALAEETKQQFPELRSVRGYFQIRSQEVIKTVALRRPELSEEAALKAEGLANLRRYALGQPVDFAWMMVKKVWRLWGGYSVGSDQRRVASVMTYHLTLVFLGFAALLVGLIVTRRKLLLLPAGALLYVSALNSILVSESRHNLTLIPTLACAGAAGGVLTVRHLRARRAAAAAPVEDGATGERQPAAVAT
ncbi:MAG: hypothetical protein H0V81_01585 [Solirubrobacterales bacterium]|nr:hypothetical protein [Solirubrobacterales bacterium]